MQHNANSAKCNIMPASAKCKIMPKVQMQHIICAMITKGSLTASPNYWDQQVDLCHFALNLSCCHWSDLWDNLKCIFIYIYLNTIEHKQKSLKSAFIWRHFNIRYTRKMNSNQYIQWHRVLLGTYLGTLAYRIQMAMSKLLGQNSRTMSFN